MATGDESKVRELMDRVGAILHDIPPEYSPPETGDLIYRLIAEVTGVKDPFERSKKEHIAKALDLYPELKKLIGQSRDPLLTAVRLAVAGNVIDMGIKRSFRLEEEIRKVLKQDFAIFHFREFRKSLEKARSVLYIGDNAGESVFDRLLIGELGKPVTYVVREVPVINDVTRGDAVASGLAREAEIISSGTTAPGTILRLCRPEFIKRFHDADMIIAKGQGNYEGLSDCGRTVFFLLMAKCRVIAADLDVQENDIVLKAGGFAS